MRVQRVEHAQRVQRRATHGSLEQSSAGTGRVAAGKRRRTGVMLRHGGTLATLGTCPDEGRGGDKDVSFKDENFGGGGIGNLLKIFLKKSVLFVLK